MIETWGRSQSRVIPVLLRYGADLGRALSGTRAPHRRTVNKLYLERVHAAGGFKAYEKAHRAKLLTTFTPKFTHLVPPELVAHIVDLWAHIGYY